MMRNRLNRTIFFTLGILGLLMFGFVFTAVSASSNYQLTLVKGTEEYIVVQYDDSAWKTTVNHSSSPKEIFQGDANFTGAKSKQTIKGWVDTIYSTYQAMRLLYFTPSQKEKWKTLLFNIATRINETSINDEYPDTYKAWSGTSAEWWFTKDPYPETPNSTITPIIIMKNPSDYKSILDNCNAIREKIWNEINNTTNEDPAFEVNKTADEFAWQLVTYGLGIASPRDTYLEEMVTELGCTNTTISGSTLIFNKTGVSDYSIEVIYGSKGILSTFIVKDASEDIIYKIISSNTEWFFYTLLFSFIGISAAVIIYVTMRNRKLRK